MKTHSHNDPVLTRNQRMAGFLVEREARFCFSDPWRFEIDELNLGDAMLRHLDLFCGDLKVIWSIDLDGWGDAPRYVSTQNIDRIFCSLVKQNGYDYLEPCYGKMRIEIAALDESELFATVRTTYIALKDLAHQAVREATRQYFEGELDALSA